MKSLGLFFALVCSLVLCTGCNRQQAEEQEPPVITVQDPLEEAIIVEGPSDEIEPSGIGTYRIESVHPGPDGKKVRGGAEAALSEDLRIGDRVITRVYKVQDRDKNYHTIRRASYDWRFRHAKDGEDEGPEETPDPNNP